MPKLVPFLLIAVIRVEPFIDAAASIADFAAAMARFRKNWSLPTRKSVTSLRLACCEEPRTR